jgi:hypothetical protein
VTHANTPPTAGFDNRLFAIGVLAITACILFVGFLLVQNTPPAHAEGMNTAGGDYHMSTVRLSDTQEAVMVMDAAARRVAVYVWDRRREVLDLQGGIDYGLVRDQVEARRREAERRNR